MQKLNNNLPTVLKGLDRAKELEILYTSLLEFMTSTDWRGACHESCGVQYVLLNELGLECEWIVGEVSFRERKHLGRPIYFDHSWIVINEEIFDAALMKSNIPSLDSSPTIRSIRLDNLDQPEVIYKTQSGMGDDAHTMIIKNMPLSIYFDNSPMHPQLGTWALVKTIGNKLDLNLDINTLRRKYNGVFWK